MAWTALRTVVDGTDTVLASDHNNVKGNLDWLSGDAGVSLWLRVQSSAPSAPGSGVTLFYAASDGTLYYRTGASGAATPVGSTGWSRSFLTMG